MDCLDEVEKLVRELLDLLESCRGRRRAAPRPGERSYDVKDGRRVVARIYEGPEWVRAVALAPLAWARELEEYLRVIEGELRADGSPEALLEVDADEEGLRHIEYRNLETAISRVKARAALRHVVETAWLIARAARRRGGGRRGLPEDPR